MFTLQQVLIDSIPGGIIAADGELCVMRFRGKGEEIIAFSIPLSEVTKLVELCALALTEAARKGHDVDAKLTDSLYRLKVGLCKRALAHNGKTDLTLMLESGGVLAFELPAHTVASGFVPTYDSAAKLGADIH